MPQRCGSVAIVGRPNVGKSTLLNRFLGQKIAIVSPKPETTREKLLGILTLEQAQVLFLDTPGIYRGAKTLMGKHQIKQAQEALQEADVLLLMTEAPAGLTDEDQQLFRLLPRSGRHSEATRPRNLAFPNEIPPLRSAQGRDDVCAGTRNDVDVPVFLAINKADRVKKPLLLPQIAEAQRMYPFREIFPISATKGDNVPELLAAVVGALPEGPPLYPADQVTDRPMRMLAQELVREKALLFTHEEVPHAVAVRVEEWREGKENASQKDSSFEEKCPRKKRSLYVRATVYVERDSQKAILIGKGGELLKRIGQEARKEIEALAGRPVFLDLWVKVAKNWRKDPQMLRELGYG